MKLVYIAGPYSASTHDGISANIAKARYAAVWLANHEVAYFCPHLNSGHFEIYADAPESFYIALDLRVLESCDAILMLDGWEQSKGATAEFAYTGELRIPRFEWSERDYLVEWATAEVEA